MKQVRDTPDAAVAPSKTSSVPPSTITAAFNSQITVSAARNGPAGPFSLGDTVTIVWSTLPGRFAGLNFYHDATSIPIFQPSQCARSTICTSRVAANGAGDSQITTSSRSPIPTTDSTINGVDGPGRRNEHKAMLMERDAILGSVEWVMSYTGNANAAYFGIQQTPGLDGQLASPTVYRQETFSYVGASTTATSPSGQTQSTSIVTVTAGQNPSSSTPAPVAAGASESSGLSTGAKAGIAVGAVAIVAILAALFFVLFRRRRRQRHSLLAPAGTMSYNQDRSAGDLHAEKEMNVINASARADSYEMVEGPQGVGNGTPRSGTWESGTAAATAAGVGSAHHSTAPRSFEGYRDEQPHSSAVAVATAVPIRKPVATEREIGRANPNSSSISLPRGEAMSSEDRQRWDEEERRLDEAIAEAERRGNRP